MIQYVFWIQHEQMEFAVHVSVAGVSMLCSAATPVVQIFPRGK